MGDGTAVVLEKDDISLGWICDKSARANEENSLVCRHQFSRLGESLLSTDLSETACPLSSVATATVSVEEHAFLGDARLSRGLL